jgi:pyruvate/2-oxoglutarate dehydrogenase complex dihydrolipoamide dehydrogenase (E3) component
MKHQEIFDVIVIGAGQGGGPIASAFARKGRKTALIEREYPGGSCVNWGCTPTKTMIASGRVAHMARRAADYGVRTGDVSIDMPAVRQRKRDIVEMFRQGSRNAIDGTEGLEYIEGEARFSGNKEISVGLNAGGERDLEAGIFVLNVGERFRQLKLEVPDGITLHNARTIMELGKAPERLVVIGAGPVGLEFGQLFRRLGAEVTIVHRSGHVLSREDLDIADAIADILREDGIALELEATPVRIERDDDIVVTIERRDGSQSTIRASHVLVAAGRIPNTDTLDVEKTGLERDDKGYVPTNDRLETAVPGIYAIGDVRPGPKFTHIAYDDYRILKANLLEGGNRSVQDRHVPATTFIDPQLGRVGLSEREAQEQGVPYKVATMPMSRVARALETDESRGLMKVLVHAETDRILGAAILGMEGGEIASMIQIAMMGGLPYTALRDGVFPHPGLAESFNNLFGQLETP